MIPLLLSWTAWETGASRPVNVWSEGAKVWGLAEEFPDALLQALLTDAPEVRPSVVNGTSKRLTVEPEEMPLRKITGTLPEVEAYRRFVPAEYPPFHATASARQCL